VRINIKIDVRDVGLGGMDWIYMAQDNHQWRALVNTATLGFIKYSEILE
jgi:hypothetical protein